MTPVKLLLLTFGLLLSVVGGLGLGAFATAGMTPPAYSEPAYRFADHQGDDGYPS